MIEKYYHEPIFDDETSIPVILGSAPDEEVLSTSPDDLPSWETALPQLCCYVPLTSEQEKHLFRKMNCLKHQAFMSDNEEEKKDKLAHASSVRNIILKHNLRLVFSIVKCYKGKTEELFSEIIMLMLNEIIDAYDYRMTNNTFGAFASDRLRKRTWSYLARQRKDKLLQASNKVENLIDYRRDKNDIDVIEDEYQNFRNFLMETIKNDVIRDIVFRRLGLDNGKSESFLSISKTYGLTYQAIQKKFDNTMIALFGHTVNDQVIKACLGRKNDRRNH